MLYMIEAKSTGDYSFITSELGYFTWEEGLKKAKELTIRMQCYGSRTRFYITPVLDI